MANTFKSQSKVDKAVYFAFKESAGICDKLDWQTDKFSATENLGQTINLRRPNVVLATTSTIDPRSTDLTGVTQPTSGYKSHVEPYVPLTVGTKVEAVLQFSLEDMTMFVDKEEVYERSIKPAIVSIRDQVNKLFLDSLDLVTGNSVYGGSGPATMSTGDEWLSNAYEANSLLVSRGIPESEMRKSVIMCPKAVSRLATKQATIFHAPGADDVYRNGMLGKYAGFDWYSSGLLGSKVTNSSAVDITAITLPTVWTGTFSFTATIGTADLKAGTKIKFSNSAVDVNWVHPSTKVDTGYTAIFVVQADAVVGSGKTVTVAECAIATGDFQNISAAITASTDVTVINGGTTRPSYAFYDKAIAAASPIIKIPSTSKGRIIELDGLNLALIEDHWPGTTQSITKLVGYVGMAVVRPEAVVAMY